jgi:hypothetical protein
MSIAGRYWRRMVRAYHLACARDDMAAQRLTTPTGPWVCERCLAPLLEAAALREHLCTRHSLP